MKKGQSLAEYAVALGLVGIVALTSMVLLGNSVQTGLSTAMTGQTPKTVPPVVPPPGTINPGGMGGVVPPPQPGQEQICFTSGLCANIFVISANTHLDVAGGNGGEFTHQFANTLKEIADQIKAEGLDPNLAQLISDLANQGHTLGDTEGAYGNTCGSNPQLSAGTFFCSSQAQNEALTHAHTQANELFQIMFLKVSEAMNHYPGKLKNDAKAIIDSQSQQIMTLSQEYFNSYVTMSNSYQGNDLNEVGGIVDGGKLTHQSANTICTQGGHNCHQVL